MGSRGVGGVGIFLGGKDLDNFRLDWIGRKGIGVLFVWDWRYGVWDDTICFLGEGLAFLAGFYDGAGVYDGRVLSDVL